MILHASGEGDLLVPGLAVIGSILTGSSLASTYVAHQRWIMAVTLLVALVVGAVLRLRQTDHDHEHTSTGGDGRGD